jgi:stress response protein SCP2
MSRLTSPHLTAYHLFNPPSSSLSFSEYSLRRYETYELLDRVTDARLKAATKAVDGVDFQSRKLQKHALGPLATRFHTYIRAAIAAMGKDIDLFFSGVTLEEDGVAEERRVWSFPQQDGVFSDSDEDLEMTRLCVLEGLNHARLPQDLTAQKMMLDIFWACAHGTDTDVDASLIMFDGSGAVCDSVYHLISNSKDGSILHKGDVSGEHDTAQGGDATPGAEAAQGAEAAEAEAAEGEGKEAGEKKVATAPGSGRASHASHHPMEEEEDMETFEFRLQHTDPKVRVIAVVLNVATDNEDLKYVHRCGLRIRVPGASSADVLDTIADFDLTTRRLNSGHEILLALLYRDKADQTQWHLTGVGELVQGEERAKEPSQNFMNALPLAMYYTRKLGILDSIEGTHTVTFNPFRMLPGDKMVVPEMAIEHPVVIGMGWDVDPDVQMDLDCGLAVYCDARRTDYCDFEKLISNDKAIEHQGDNRDGEGEGDDEQIIIQFTKIDPQSDTLFLYAAVYEGGALKDVQNVHIRMLTQRNGKVKVCHVLARLCR